MSITETTKKLLYAKSGNRCMFENCEHRLFDNHNNISEIAHISGKKKGSARYDPNETNVDDESNLIVLCRIHHKIIDNNEEIYTKEYLLNMKRNSELNIQRKIDIDKDFCHEIRKIFINNCFDEIFIEQNFTSPFSEKYFEHIENGKNEISELMKRECFISYNHDTIRELLNLIDNTMANIATNVQFNNGFCIPKNNEYLDSIASMVEEIRKFILSIYND